MLRGKEEIRIKVIDVMERFREKDATSPEKTLTVHELRLPPWFERTMRGRLGQLGTFVEANGKYYVNEERLKQLQEQYFRAGQERRGWRLAPLRKDSADATARTHYFSCTILYLTT